MEDSDGLLEMYISYDYLPVEQHNNINQSLNGIYTTLAQLTRPDWPEIEFWLYFRRAHKQYYHHGDHHYSVPLCLASVHTGESITLKFDVERKFIPRITGSNGDVEVAIPKWSAALIVAGAMLKGGLGLYGEYLGVEKKGYEIQKLQLEIERLQGQIQEEINSKNSPALSSVKKNIELFKQEVSQPNIKRVTIDRHQVKNLTSQ